MRGWSYKNIETLGGLQVCMGRASLHKVQI
jgi:hypothetical protein